MNSEAGLIFFFSKIIMKDFLLEGNYWVKNILQRIVYDVSLSTPVAK